MVAINISLKGIERTLAITCKIARRILTNHHSHLYHITHTDSYQTDMQRRLNFYRWIQQRINPDFNFVLPNDEATFHNTKQLNCHNCHYCV